MEQKKSNAQHLMLGKIVIDKQVISQMESDHLFHDFVYNCIMLHETGECNRYSVNQNIKSTHKYESTGATFDINTELEGMKTSIISSI